jgi:hypothetical protein
MSISLTLFRAMLFTLVLALPTFGADQKITELTADTSPTEDDLIVTVDDPAGTPANKKVTVDDLFTAGLDIWQAANQPLCLEDGTNCPTSTDHGALTGLNDADHNAVYCLYTVAATAPSAGAVAAPCHFYIDDSTSPKTIYYGEGAASDFELFGDLGDAHNETNNGVHSATATGSETLRRAGMDGIIPVEVFNKSATFTNQPANDGVEGISSSASDTQVCTIYGTVSGGNERVVVSEALTLTGTSQASTTRTNWNNILGIRCASNAVGTITFREASGNATITTITAGNAVAGHIDLLVYGIQDAGIATTKLVNHVKSQVLQLSTDGTQCGDPAYRQINSGWRGPTIICTDNDAATIYGLGQVPDSWAGGTFTFEVQYVQTAADTAVLNADIAAACRSAGDTMNNTWGSEVAVDDAAVTGSNGLDHTTSGAVTPDGTCAAGDTLFVRFQIDATGTTTAVATLHFIAIKAEYTVTGAGSD